MTNEEFDSLLAAWVDFKQACGAMGAAMAAYSYKAGKEPAQPERDFVQAMGMRFHWDFWAPHRDAIADMIRNKHPDKVERVFRFDPKIKNDLGEIDKTFAMNFLTSHHGRLK